MPKVPPVPPGGTLEPDEVARYRRLLVSKDPVKRLEAITALRRHTMAAEAFAVREARKLGRSWDEIGQALGASRQAAQQKWGHARKKLPLERPENTGLKPRVKVR